MPPSDSTKPAPIGDHCRGTHLWRHGRDHENSAKKPTSAVPAATGTGRASATTRPSTTTDARMMGSTKGSPTPPTASRNPKAHDADEGPLGTNNNARPPISDAQSPTATMASTWSSPKIGVQQPAHEGPMTVQWGMAGVRRRSSRNQQKREGKGKTSQHRICPCEKVPSEWGGGGGGS